MKEPKPHIRTTWKSNWLIEFSVAFLILGVVTREPLIQAVGIAVSLMLALLWIQFYRSVNSIGSRLHVQQHVRRSKVFLGETVEGKLTINNESSTFAHVHAIRPTPNENLSIELHGSIDDRIPPGGETSLPFTIKPLRRGKFQITCFSLILTDPRYLFTTEAEYEQRGWLEILPGTVEPLTPVTLYAGGTDSLRRTPMGVDYAGIREYTVGDEYHRVEWKATARLRRLMVKEFHPETRTNLQILIDTGGSMQKRSYVGTRLDEALAVAQLLVQAAVQLEKSANLYFYDEKNLVKCLKSTDGEGQIAALREFPRSGERIEGGTWFSNSSGLARSVFAQSDQVVAYFRSLKHIQSKRYRDTGVYKAVREAALLADSVLVVLTALESNTEALIEAASTHQEHGVKIIVAQIGATWRLTSSLDHAYENYQRNIHTLMRVRTEGLTIFDARPERVMETIVKDLGRSLTVASTTLPT